VEEKAQGAVSPAQTIAEKAEIPAASIEVEQEVQITLGRPDFSFDNVQGFFHSQNMTGDWSEPALQAISKYPIVTTEKGQNFYNNMNFETSGFGQAEEKIIQSCKAIKAAAKAAGRTTKAFFYWNAQYNYYHFGSNAWQKDHPEWFLKKKNGQTMVKVANGPNGGVQWYDFRNPDLRSAWKAKALFAARNGCDGVFIDNTQHFGGYHTDARRFAGLSWAESANLERAHRDVINELNYELEQEGKFAINNNAGQGITNGKAVMIERFGPTVECIKKLQALRSRGMMIEAHAGSMHSKTRQTCKNGDTNALAVFLLGMGQHSYYSCSMYV
jgi:hypothetical protein